MHIFESHSSLSFKNISSSAHLLLRNLGPTSAAFFPAHHITCIFFNLFPSPFFFLHVFPFLQYTDGPCVILSYRYHGNHTVQVQTYPSPRSWGIRSFKRIIYCMCRICNMYTHCSFFWQHFISSMATCDSIQTCQCCVFSRLVYRIHGRH